MPGHNVALIYRNVLERAKDLLTTLHARVLEAEKILHERLEEQQRKNAEEMLAIENGPETAHTQPSRLSKSRGGTAASDIYATRQKLQDLKLKQSEKVKDLITKVYPSDVIPDQYIERKRDYRPNNFKS